MTCNVFAKMQKKIVSAPFISERSKYYYVGRKAKENDSSHMGAAVLAHDDYVRIKKKKQ